MNFNGMIDQLSVFVENETGKLAEITGIIKKSGVDLKALSLADTANFGVLRVVCDDAALCRKALSDAGIVTKITKVRGVKLPDKPGAFADILEKLSSKGIGVEYAYAFLSHDDDGAYAVLSGKGIETVEF